MRSCRLSVIMALATLELPAQIELQVINYPPVSDDAMLGVLQVGSLADWLSPRVSERRGIDIDLIGRDTAQPMGVEIPEPGAIVGSIRFPGPQRAEEKLRLARAILAGDAVLTVADAAAPDDASDPPPPAAGSAAAAASSAPPAGTDGAPPSAAAGAGKPAAASEPAPPSGAAATAATPAASKRGKTGSAKA